MTSQLDGLNAALAGSGVATDGESLLTTAELAAVLKISKQWVRDHAAGRRRPHLPALRLSGQLRPTYRFKLSEVLACLKNLPTFQRSEKGGAA